jgi:hypothetical protein
MGRSSGDEQTEEGQRLRPSSKASREAALSKVTSDNSQPPLGTRKVEKQHEQKIPTKRRKKRAMLNAKDVSKRHETRNPYRTRNENP